MGVNSAPESSTLTTRLPSSPTNLEFQKKIRGGPLDPRFPWKRKREGETGDMEKRKGRGWREGKEREGKCGEEGAPLNKNFSLHH